MERQRYYSCSSRRRRFLRPVTPRLVYLSSKLGTRTNDDSEVRRLRSRESRELLKSNESNALSHFFRVERLGEGTRIQVSQNPQVFTRLMCANPPSFFTTKYHYEFKRFFFICISHILYCGNSLFFLQLRQKSWCK